MAYKPFPVYSIEFYCTYADAVWIYDQGGIDEYFTTENEGEEIASFAYETEARGYFKKYRCDRMSFWDPDDYDPDKPELGVGYYLLVKYDKWNDTGEVLEKSKGTLTKRQMQIMFKKSGIDLKELSKKRRKNDRAV